jgi:TonB family protein
MGWVEETEMMRKIAWVLGLMVLAGTVAWGQNVVPLPDKDGVYSMGKGLTPAKLIQGFPANYPSDPGLAGVKHVVALHVVIGADGTPGVIELVNAHSSPFDDAAIAAVKASQFAPASYKGNPVPTRLELWVPFLGDKQLAVPVAALSTAKGVSVPRALNSVEAEFPKQARKDDAEGVVLIHMLVTEDGLPSDIRVLRPAGHGFDENALKAAGKYRFTPAKVYGVPVPMDITIEVNFRRN